MYLSSFGGFVGFWVMLVVSVLNSSISILAL
jgi:hypothetical protein